jgi:hypothetical protein
MCGIKTFSPYPEVDNPAESSAEEVTLRMSATKQAV